MFLPTVTTMLPVHANLPSRLWNKPSSKRANGERLQSPETTGGINILLEEGIYPQYKSLFIRPEDSGTTDSPTRITAVPNARVVLSGGVPVTGWEQGCKDTRIPETLRNKIWVAEAPRMGKDIGNPTNVGQRSKSTAGRTVSRRSNGTHD